MAVIGDMLGVLPTERSMLLKWSDDLVCGLSSHIDPTSETAQAVMAAFAAYTEFTTSIITKRRAEPTDDLFSILVNAEVEGQRMSDDEIVMETLLILIGGDETTRHTLSGGPNSWCATAISGMPWCATRRCFRVRSRKCCAGRRRSRTCAGP